MESLKRRVLVVEDDPSMQQLISSVLSEDGFRCETTATVTEAYQMVNEDNFDLLVLDRKLPDGDGVRLLRRLRSKEVLTPAIVVTAHPSVDTAAEALQSAAFDYLTKPFEPAQLLEKAQCAVADQMLIDENLFLWKTLKQKYGWSHVMSRNPPTQHTYIVAAKAAASFAPVLVEGETGTGKEYLARAVHYFSDRAEQAMVTVNCGGFPDELLENELFGHEKGAFTSANSAKPGLCEVADGGTLFLDEIGHMSSAMQIKLLRFVEDHSFARLGATKPVTVDVRIITASNQPLAEMVQSGQFREDLYYRLNVIPLKLRPLRQRPEDIEPFTKHFMQQFDFADTKWITSEGWQKLHEYDWPGNLRELRNVIQRAGVLTSGEAIKPKHLLLQGQATASDGAVENPSDESSPTSPLLSIEEMERQHIIAVLETCDGDRRAAAEILGVSPSTLYRRLNKYGIERDC